VQAVRARNWSKVYDAVVEVLPEVAVSQSELRARLSRELATARYQLKHDPELIQEAADVRGSLSLARTRAHGMLLQMMALRSSP
jgi:hypothetical protein